jgi:hypothetical protein
MKTKKSRNFPFSLKFPLAPGKYSFILFVVAAVTIRVVVSPGLDFVSFIRCAIVLALNFSTFRQCSNNQPTTTWFLLLDFALT